MRLRCPVHGEFRVTANNGESETCPTCLTQAALYRQIEPDGVEGVRPKDEFDPTGTEAHEPGAKLDGGKLIAGELILSFPHAMEALATIATYGAKKYSRTGFLHVPDAEVRYMDALMRHLLKHGQGERLDQESGLPHLDHALWNIAAIVELGRREKMEEL